ncbi:MAG: ATP phosphoribosyltransferase regulatory subunit [Synechococcales cyanobacterium RM1_1_8]|nr:ATP phosphoribosyltransferase regulatory subunit [Synechococcales cyanobacterium RM1_1_8]
MVYQPPLGARDFLPLEVAQQQWIESSVRDVFERWGYQRIVTSTLERLETLMAGGAVQRQRVLQVLSEDVGELGLRPELTASIARAAVTRLIKAPRPLRLFYLANVFRRPPGQESYQAGVELLGAGSVLADVEMLLLLSDCLAELGLNSQLSQGQCTIILGQAALTKSLLLPFPELLRAKVLAAIAHLDRLTLETLDLSVELRDRALALMDLRGQSADVLAALQQFNLDPEQQAIAQRLAQLTQLLGARLGDAGPAVILDLSLVQTFDYYTGIVFEVACEAAGTNGIVGQGGRYDQLLGLYHPQQETSPGIGFSLDIERLQQVLQSTGQLPPAPPPVDWLVVPLGSEDYVAALDHRKRLRETASVELYLEPVVELEAVRAYARDRAIAQIAWVKAGQVSEEQTLLR